MRLVLVRHGQTTSNISGALDTGRPGAPLSAKGLQQAHQLASTWEDIAPRPTVIGVSPLLRTRQTAQPLLERYGLIPRVLPGLREVRAGNLEMSTALTDLAQYMKAMLPWIQGNWEPRMPGGESGYEILGRILPAIHTLVTEAHEKEGANATTVIVAHGAINRLIASALSPQIGANLVMMYRLDNCGTCVLETSTDFTPSTADELLHSFTAHSWNNKPMSEWDIPTEINVAVKY